MKPVELAQLISEKIDSGDYPYGSALPTMADLGSQHGMSRPTVSAALGMLAAQGKVRSYSDKRGTIVTAPKSQTWHLGTFASRPSSRKEPEGEVSESVTLTREGAAEDEAALFDISTGEEMSVRTSVKTIDGAPVRHRRYVTPMSVASRAPEGWTGTPPMLMTDAPRPPQGMSVSDWCGMGVAKIDETVKASLATADIASALGLDEGALVLTKTTLGIREGGSIVYRTVTAYHLNAEITLGIEDS